MKILGISGSPRKDEQSGTYRLVKRVCEATGMQYELVSLRSKRISGCIACLGCVKDNVCIVQDDLKFLRSKIVDADAYVIGSPNYYGSMNTLTQALLERWFQFRHQTGDLLWGKLGVAVGVGGSDGMVVADGIERMYTYNLIETVAKVSGQGAASCYSCGYGESCQVGIPIMVHGQGVKITEDMIPDVEKQPAVLKAADDAGAYLAERLGKHDRQEVTKKMQMVLMERFNESA